MSPKVGAVLVLALALSSCTSVRLYNPQPDKMYEGDLPLSDTAVFSAHDELSAVCLAATVQMVDSNKTSRWTFPMWVRVAPGNHSFVVQCTTEASRGFNEVSRKYANLEIEVPDIKPRHVYVAHYEEVAGKIRITTEDLGENSYYSVQIGEKLVTPEF